MASRLRSDPTLRRGSAGMSGYATDHSAALLLFPRPCQVDVGSSICIRIEER